VLCSHFGDAVLTLTPLLASSKLACFNRLKPTASVEDNRHGMLSITEGRKRGHVMLEWETFSMFLINLQHLIRFDAPNSVWKETNFLQFRVPLYIHVDDFGCFNYRAPDSHACMSLKHLSCRIRPVVRVCQIV
jgi:hypothetical protein